MTTVKRIKQDIRKLSDAERAELREWFMQFDQAAGEAELSRRVDLIKSSIDQHDREESRDGFQALSEMKQKAGATQLPKAAVCEPS